MRKVDTENMANQLRQKILIFVQSQVLLATLRLMPFWEPNCLMGQ